MTVDVEAADLVADDALGASAEERLGRFAVGCAPPLAVALKAELGEELVQSFEDDGRDGLLEECDWGCSLGGACRCHQ